MEPEDIVNNKFIDDKCFNKMDYRLFRCFNGSR